MGASYVGILVLQLANVLTEYTLWLLQTYLTGVWKLNFTHAAGILNIWKGITKILPVGFIFFVDTFLGHYGMLVLSSIAFCLGLGLLSASTSPPVLVCYLGTCKNYKPKSVSALRKALFYTALALIAVGKAGHRVSANPFLLEQTKKQVQDKQSENNPDVHSVQGKQVQDKQSEKVQGKQSEKDSDVNEVQGKQSENASKVHPVQDKKSENAPDEHPVHYILVVIMSMIGGIGVPYIKAWSIRFGVPAIYTFVATLVFLCSSCLYKISKPKGSPWTNVCRVFVASALNISKPYKKEEEGGTGTAESQKNKKTRFLRCLDKAALPNKKVEEGNNRWRHCTKAEVEEAQIVVRTVPMWMTFVVCGIVSSFGNTYFVEQAKSMDTKLGKWETPPSVLRLLYDLAKNFIFAKLCNYMMEKCFSDKCKKYAPPVGIAMAMVLSILCCITASIVETRRLNDTKLSMFWLILPFFLLAGLDAFFEKGVEEFFKAQAPESMRNYLNHFSQGVYGLGFMGSVVSVYVVDKVTREKGPIRWFQDDLNKSRLDKYYRVLAALSSVNLLVYILIAFCYRYKDPAEQKSDQQDDLKRMNMLKGKKVNEDHGDTIRDFTGNNGASDP